MSGSMRLDPAASNNNTNGHRHHTNGTSLQPTHKPFLSTTNNGHPQATNGSAPKYQNGLPTSPSKIRSPSYFGHDREEVARLLIQALHDLGYNETANQLVHESGYELESPSVAAFRHAVLHGEWSDAESLLFGSSVSRDDGGVSISNGDLVHHQGLALAEGADRDELRFLLRKQKYLELLEERDLGGALMVLRQELTPLHRDVVVLHNLSSLIVCQSAEDLKLRASWDGALGTSRSILLVELSKSISPSVMMPDHRLAVLLDHVKRAQISKCLYHNPSSSPSLFLDHVCDRSHFPLQTVIELSQNPGEVWHLAFSNDGKRLATSGQGTEVVIYDTINFQVQHRLSEHGEGVAYVAWSPDDSKLVTCCRDRKVRLWDAMSGRCILIIDHHTMAVTTASWAPNGQSFVTGSCEKQSQLCVWSLTGRALYTWSNEYRVQDCAISPDGQRLVIISPEKQIVVFNFITREEEYSLRLKSMLTCINISRDSKHMLINMADDELQLIDINSAEIVRRFLGQKQGQYVIRSTFGGADENLVISGSEDGKVYIWHKENGTLIETLEGHTNGAVNAVAWNPADSCMFASAGDDRKVRIWSKEPNPSLRPRTTLEEFHRNR